VHSVSIWRSRLLDYKLAFFSVVLLLSVHFAVSLVRWLGGSFAKLGFSVGLCGFANVPPNALAI